MKHLKYDTIELLEAGLHPNKSILKPSNYDLTVYMNYNTTKEYYFHYNPKTKYTHKYYKPVPANVGEYTPNTSVWYKIDGTTLYITGHEKEGYLERILYTDSTLSKNGWNANTTITKAIIEEKIYPTSCARFFNSCSNLTTIENFENIIITKYCTTLFCMFQLCSKLVNIDCTNWDTSNVTTMKNMFYNCFMLDGVGDLSNWDISNVTTTYCMFYGCNSLTSIGNLDNWDISNVTTMAAMFNKCYALSNIGDLGNWDTSKVTDMFVMFQWCNALTNIGDLGNWDTSKVTDMSFMFNKCYALSNIGDLSEWNVSNVSTLEQMFANCASLTNIGDLSNWNAPKCTTTKWMFGGDSKVDKMRFTELKLDNLFKNGIVTDMSFMFNKCEGLTTVGDLSNWDTSNVTTMKAMFNYCNALTNIGDLSNWNTSNVTNMSFMFNQCNSLTSVGDLSNWDTSKVTDMSTMFQCCYKLTSVGDLSNWDISNVTDMSWMFYDNDKMEELIFKNIVSSKLTTMRLGLSRYYKLKKLYMSGLNTSVLTNMQSCFANNTSLEYIDDCSNWNTPLLSDFRWGFANDINLKTIDGLMPITKSMDTSSLFENCTSLININKSGTISQSVSFAWSPLTHDSALVLINALDSTNTGTLTLSSSTYATLTDEDKAIATNKGWTIAR